ncbi:MAG: hypothetical protein PUB38_10930 [Prevotella sp.]|nr:hypothetical protein [Prevotella sp.]
MGNYYTTHKIMLLSVAMFATSFLGGGEVKAQTTSTSATGDGSVITGVDKLTSSDPATLKVTDESQYTNNDPKHVFFLYNVGLKKFVGNGGFYGTAAGIVTTPKYFFIYDNSTVDKGNCYNIRCKQRTANTTSDDPTSSHDYLKYYNHDNVQSSKAPNLGNGFYLDRTYNEVYTYSSSKTAPTGGWYFVSATTSDGQPGYQLVLNNAYLEKDKADPTSIYLVGREYDSANPDNPTCYDLDGGSYSYYVNNLARTDIRDNSVWRLISLADYQKLYSQSPVTLDAPIDASFLLKDPGFMFNNSSYSKEWKTTTGTSIKLGLDKLYITTTDPGTTPTYKFTETSGYKQVTYQFYNGRYSCAKIIGQNGQLYQTVALTKNGWFAFACNGVSNTGAKLFAYIQKSSTDGTAQDNTTVEKDIDNYTYSGDDDMLAAGKDFLANNAHTNQVMINVTGASDSNPVYVRFGIITGNGGTSSAKPNILKAEAASTDGVTIVDDFKMYYAGASSTPDLVLDEDNENMTYLTATSDTYTNSTLHLRRAFTANQWNTIILPVSLSKSQLTSAFGSDMMLAKLYQLTDNSIQFLTVDDNDDNGYMLQAYTPYIIKPSNDGPGTTQEYSTTLNTTSGVWKGTYQRTSSESGTTVKVPANHYTIARVSFDRDAVAKNVSTETWETSTNQSASLSDKTLTCKGTMGRTYSETTSGSTTTRTIISGRDNLSGDYFFKNGAIYQVPADKTYGLKAFRCWFELGNSSPAKAVTVYIDNVADTSTGISDITTDPQAASTRTVKGIYNLQGVRLRDGSSTQGLPSGLYIVNGKLTMVR